MNNVEQFQQKAKERSDAAMASATTLAASVQAITTAHADYTKKAPNLLTAEVGAHSLSPSVSKSPYSESDLFPLLVPHGKRRSSGHGSEVLLSRQQLIDIAVLVTIDEAREDVGQIRERVDVVQLADPDHGRINDLRSSWRPFERLLQSQPVRMLQFDY
jgi:hypothetical protein